MNLPKKRFQKGQILAHVRLIVTWQIVAPFVFISNPYHSSNRRTGVGCEVVGRKDCYFPLFEISQVLDEQFGFETIWMIKIGFCSLFHCFVRLISIIMVVGQIDTVAFAAECLVNCLRQRCLEIMIPTSDSVVKFVIQNQSVFA